MSSKRALAGAILACCFVATNVPLRGGQESTKDGRTVENVKGRVAPAQGDLLLGQSFLGRFRSWSIDNKTNELLPEN
jgi:hypothetical protein